MVHKSSRAVVKTFQTSETCRADQGPGWTAADTLRGGARGRDTAFTTLPLTLRRNLPEIRSASEVWMGDGSSSLRAIPLLVACPRSLASVFGTDLSARLKPSGPGLRGYRLRGVLVRRVFPLRSTLCHSRLSRISRRRKNGFLKLFCNTGGTRMGPPN